MMPMEILSQSSLAGVGRAKKLSIYEQRSPPAASIQYIFTVAALCYNVPMITLGHIGFHPKEEPLSLCEIFYSYNEFLYLLCSRSTESLSMVQIFPLQHLVICPPSI
jgi:hypothetical protein